MNSNDVDVLKQKLVHAILMLEREQIIDYNGHFSARIPETDLILINSASSARSALTVNDIVVIDANGKLVEGHDNPPMEFHIHTEIYRVRNDVHSIVHAHPRWSTYFSMTGNEVKPVFPQAALLGDIQFFPHIYSINTEEYGKNLAQALGKHKTALLKAHGSVVAAGAVEETFALCFYLEQNAERQYMALPLGEPYVLSRQEIQDFAANLGRPHILRKVWDYHQAKLLEEE